MVEAEALGKSRFEQLIEMRGNAAHCTARRSEQQDGGSMAHHKILPAVQLLPQAAEALHAFAEKASQFLGAIVNPYKPSNALQNVNLTCEISRLPSCSDG